MWKKKHLYDETAHGYDAFIRGFVPQYDTMQDRVVDVVREVSATEELDTLVELGVGTGNLAFRLLTTLAIRTYVGYETSESLGKLAASRLSIFKQGVTVRSRDFREDDWPVDVDAVVSSLTLHYLSNEEKRLIFAKAFRSLKARGVLVVGDRVISHSPTMNEVYHARMERSWDATTRNWQAQHRKKHQTQDDPKEEPWLLEDQLAALREVGFAEVECVWRDFNYCVYVGIMPHAQE